MIRIALVYFALVFAVGFALGPIRVLLLEPRLGVRTAELLEAPLMFLAICYFARWVAKRWVDKMQTPNRLTVGFFAAGLVLLTDIVVGMGMRGMSLTKVFFNRDAVSGAVYYGLIVWMVIAPWWFGRNLSPRSNAR